ncbi:hypothetical protein BCT75_04145 [Vibrio lentus]|uniref:type IV secretory system conjugative DNA transfer family protein n=1 Tax=Vibrio lentus TaxID=136468 RepID=UPI000C83FF2D|nr:type IV secretory system conjugative DNA transfer family protein [Vibrio lentus]PML45580.1 hypothetical protein BCT75_04145 [Vibrio lentus]
MKTKIIITGIFTLLLQHILALSLIVFYVDANFLQKNSIQLFYPTLFNETILMALAFCLPMFFWLAVIVIELIKNNNKDYGDAQFASNFEISRMQKKGVFEPKGTIFGLKNNRYIRTNSSLSTLIVAPQGTGKTAAVMIPTLLSNTNSFIINDIKGELWDLTSKQRANFGRVGIFAPSQNLTDSLSWNPLDKKVMPNNFADQIDFVERVAAILYPTEQDGLDATSKHFNGEAKSMFTYFAMLLISQNGGTSLPEIYRTALDSGDMQESIACDIDELGESWHSALLTIANSIMQKGGNEFQGTVTTFKQALEPFSRPNIARNLERCDFTHLDFKADKPFSLYLNIPANDVERLAPVMRMLVEYLVKEFLALKDKKIIEAQHVVFGMDEFPRMGYMKALKEAPALQRSFNMSSIFIAQDKNQLETTYGKGSFDQFVTTTDYKVIFRQNEDTTAARFSALVGKTTKRKKSVSKRDLDLLGSSSESKEGLPLMLPQDFMNQKTDDLTILISGHYDRPIKAKCAWWFKDQSMKRLIGAYKDLTVSDLTQINAPDSETNRATTPIINNNKEESAIEHDDDKNNNIEPNNANSVGAIDNETIEKQESEHQEGAQIKEPTLDF